MDYNNISVSGFSSGAFMAMQINVIYSSKITGAGIISGGVYGGVSHQDAALTTELHANSMESKQNIDPLSNLEHSRVFLYRGTRDTIAWTNFEKTALSFYQHYIHDPTHIKTKFDIPAEHGFPSDNYGGQCASLNYPEFINNCGYNAAYEILNHIYGGNLLKPDIDTVATGTLYKFNQDEFIQPQWGNSYSFDHSGFIYVPSACADKTQKCKLHVVFHGCLMGRHNIHDKFVLHAGYNEVADLNNIIILYPQITISVLDAFGCWDWFGYTGSNFGGYKYTYVTMKLSNAVPSTIRFFLLTD